MERRVIEVEGIVQGVGFRPFVHILAVRLGLAGFVQNRVGRVRIEVEGNPERLNQFLVELAEQSPPLARVERLSWTQDYLRGESFFVIRPSEDQQPGPIFISPDAATCYDCLTELLDPADRRFHYPFLNCTQCGPRLTVVTGAPYDRPKTTLAGFPLCSACQAEYDNPRDRRFHAQATCCPVCGPQLALLNAGGTALPGDPVERFASAIRLGQIGALKGLGGYQLICDATDPAVVAELRRRKHRNEKPFALLVAEAIQAEQLCEISSDERELLVSWRRPIVLLRRRRDIPIADAVAPGNPWLGIQLPCTPLHHLLVRATPGLPLVLTSGNRSDEPIAITEAAALDGLADIADLFLTHNRPIAIRCDDSVTRMIQGAEVPLRRSRGYAPDPIALPFSCPRPILAVGGQLKATFALGRDHHAFLSHHLGDLDHYEAYRAFERDVERYQNLFAIQPALIAHDAHPGYASTEYARSRGEPTLAIQHHHAHMASCMAENGLTQPVIGVILDGTGYGEDGTIWGGEFLLGDYHQYQRGAHLRPVPMPGGEMAIREPWRMALAHLLDAGVTCSRWSEQIPGPTQALVTRLIQNRINSPFTSSMGRLFDAVASLTGVCHKASYEGQAAMQLEWIADRMPPEEAYSFAVSDSLPVVVDTRPLIAEVVRDVHDAVPAARIARRFHSTLVAMIAQVCERLRQRTQHEDIVLSGGVFQNALLLAEVCEVLTNQGFRVYRHRLVPPGDGGLSLGQLAIAAHSQNEPS